MNAERPRVLSGMQPSADSLHLGNYIGALRQWVAMQETHETFYFVADRHSITVDFDPAQLRHRTRATAAQFIAAGVDPERSTLFVQSQVPEHSELTWVLGCITGFGEASRMTQFKDKSAKGGAERASVGLFTYPVLMAADILIYQAHQVPVGDDQRQHLELTRDLAERFNQRFGRTFRLPEGFIPPQAARIYDLQDPAAKMSKSGSHPQGIVELLDEPGPLRKKIMRAVTDTGSEIRADKENKPGVTNLLNIHSALSGEPVPELEKRFDGAGYGTFKKELAEVVIDTLAPIRERAKELLADPAELDRLLAAGAARARAQASATLAQVRERIGFLAPPDEG
ncbi:tryptophan--tRNA ligase [Allonocardiopsis opalescens]|uniref:Tryptophan--tRNA ligase n=1 Tax=Allonocardiopsis opalescens TaxID=1144618 RepID=A0A2T0PSI5_9ACTN|nr:tryptophan--tRNA ligase [Allonocardiopsis opalescens]PRX91853.1 tryptophanyl-tRNA synthetase [Allonocardiopsis opalescens]